MQSDHFDGKHFFTPGAPPIAGWKMILRWWFSKGARGHWPRWIDIPQQVPPSLSASSEKESPDRAIATWVGHSTFLLQTTAGNFITDPVFSQHAGPLGISGPPRVHAPGVPFESLPKIDYILLSHDHYDHCDLKTLRRLMRRDSPVAITPLGNGRLFRRAGFQKAIELDWWENAAISTDTRVTVTPAQHWSKRLSSTRCSRLWGGFFLEIGSLRIYFTVDTGYNDQFFHDIRTRLGQPDLAMIPIGAYEPRWFMTPQHCNPAEAVKIHQKIGSKLSLAMHWGTFRLTDEGRDDPPNALAAALTKQKISPASFRVLQPGESVCV
ncbi:MAG: MBL fold metallo-hydrolase [Puniceicoccales bacterium]|jgi:L-ascorbate metabolism protein UlaG (beta-lactamase superfamily)|nr:MBL fold metallo-hydrolase [Puniceicoccales bacterium]